jgi:hypothetical protein
MTFDTICKRKAKLISQNNKSAYTVHCHFKDKNHKGVLLFSSWHFWANVENIWEKYSSVCSA